MGDIVFIAVGPWVWNYLPL